MPVQDMLATGLGTYTVSTSTDGYLKYDASPLTYLLVNAVLELSKMVSEQQAIIQKQQSSIEKQQTVILILQKEVQQLKEKMK